MAYQAVFDGALCMDAMENICPEDWPLVLSNFHQALKQQGYLYFTVETVENADENEIKEAFQRAQQAGLPFVYGEWPDEPTGQGVDAKAGFAILKEGNGICITIFSYARWLVQQK